MYAHVENENNLKHKILTHQP